MKYTSIHKLLVIQSYWSIYQEYTISVLIINVLVYLCLTALIFGLIFIFDQKYFKTLNELQGLNSSSFILMSFIFGLLSLAGMPPLIGFLSKFLLVITVLKNYHFFLLFIFTFINLFMIYFYIQNMRLLQRPSIKNLIRVKNYFALVDLKLLYLLIIFNSINWFGILVLSDILVWINFVNSHIRIG
jgi:NADH:ubiquinone oxidoreductase subunit 2 (subunit N)